MPLSFLSLLCYTEKILVLVLLRLSTLFLLDGGLELFSFGFISWLNVKLKNWPVFLWESLFFLMDSLSSFDILY